MAGDERIAALLSDAQAFVGEQWSNLGSHAGPE
jgi:hypothetical protein